MATNVIFSFIAIDQFSAIGKSIARTSQNMREKFAGVSESVKRADERMEALAARVKKTAAGMKELGESLSLRVTLPIAAAGTAALIQSSKFEQLGISFEVMAGSAEKGRKIMEDVTKFSASTPFKLGEVADSAKQLLSFGVKGEEVTNVLRRLGDMAAGTGKPLGEFSLIYGKVLAKGKVSGEEVQQLAEKGISLTSALAEKYKVSPQVITQAVTAGKITFKEFNSVLEDMTNKGGRFYQMTQKQSQSLGGLWSTFTDNIDLAMRAVGDAIVQSTGLKDILASAANWMNDLGASIAAFAKEHPKITKFIVIFMGVLAVVGPLLVGLGIMAQVIPLVAAGVGLLGAAFGLLMSPVTLIILAIAAVAAGAYYLYQKFDVVRAIVYALIHPIDTLKYAWGEVVSFFKSSPEAFLGPFGMISAGIKFLYKNVAWFRDGVDTMIGAVREQIEGLVHVWERIKGVFTSEVPAAAVNANLQQSITQKGAVDITNNSRTMIDVNLRGPRGAVESVRTQSTGKAPGLNMGVNMAGEQ